jgi:hypothetical protein
MTPAQRGARTRKQRAKLNALLDAYAAKFPQYQGGSISTEVQRAMRVALKTGIEQPVLIEQRKQIERNCRNYDARLKREHARPFTPKLEKQYTARIKNRHLIEGDCERPWQNYFGYRDKHPKDVAPLDAADLAYAGQWTPLATMDRAAVRKIALDHIAS